MKLTTIATGSSGNSYLIHNENECLIVECGMPFMEVKKALDFNIRPIAGCIVSHEHGDHWKYHKDYEKTGITLLAPFQYKDICAMWGNYTITGFENPHGDTQSWGYFIKHPEMGKLIFITDFEYCPYDFSSQHVEHIMIEANYQLDMVDTDAPNFKHKIQGHCSDTTCIDFIKHNNSSHLRTVTIIHTNSNTLDEKAIVERIKAVVDTDVEVNVAKPGMEIELNKEAF